MKQVVVTAPLQYEVQEVPMPQPQPGEVLVKMMAAGVCGSDFHNFLGENPQTVYPRILGHENAGIIEQVGKGVTNVEPGDHVVVDLVVACGECPQCKRGRRNICRTVKARGAAIDGGWREYFCVPADEVYRIPKEIPFRDAALIEPFAIGGHSTQRANVTKDDVVLVLGSGTIGSIILQTCKAIGSKVICADVIESSLQRSRHYGADIIINNDKEDLIKRIQEETNGDGVDVIFDAACFPGSLTMLMQPGIPANGARIVPLGFCPATEQITQAMINGRELTIVGSRMSTGQFEPTIEKFTNHEIILEDIISDYIPFKDIGRVFENIVNAPKEMKKMVIVFEN
ncbi:alcohol dehydrogenase catalytic domain-containing protein [Paenibacillus donghaensis]|uniref:alcohol dehydrogenase catalytic domain-containing protein n=1 Tax=Paenibacillus donghaensis TaxID=414771 RepID=UPI001D16D754|nr:alcohol dehydrogenase catalytic domain-containing protein [Paenibacillus donghaensis]